MLKEKDQICILCPFFTCRDWIFLNGLHTIGFVFFPPQRKKYQKLGKIDGSNDIFRNNGPKKKLHNASWIFRKKYKYHTNIDIQSCINTHSNNTLFTYMHGFWSHTLQDTQISSLYRRIRRSRIQVLLLKPFKHSIVLTKWCPSSTQLSKDTNYKPFTLNH